jgi:hypothetical protein
MMPPPSAERDYSHRSLFEKLGVNADCHVAVAGPHDGAFVHQLNSRLAKAASEALRTRYDIIFVRVNSTRDLSRIASAAAHLKPNGAVWVIHPKGGARPTDDEVRAAGKAAGLVDNKISAYDDTHTCTRYVIPVARRGTIPPVSP